MWGISQNGGVPYWGSPIIRRIVVWGLYWGPPIYGNYLARNEYMVVEVWRSPGEKQPLTPASVLRNLGIVIDEGDHLLCPRKRGFAVGPFCWGGD